MCVAKSKLNITAKLEKWKRDDYYMIITAKYITITAIPWILSTHKMIHFLGNEFSHFTTYNTLPQARPKN